MMDTVEKVRKLLTSLQNSFHCTICLDFLSQPVSTKCNHQFCKGCFDELLTKSTRRTPAKCPLCKSGVTKRSINKNPHLAKIVTAVRDVCEAADDDSENIICGTPLSSQRVRKKNKDNDCLPKKSKNCLSFIGLKNKNEVSVDHKVETEAESSTSVSKVASEEKLEKSKDYPSEFQFSSLDDSDKNTIMNINNDESNLVSRLKKRQELEGKPDIHEENQKKYGTPRKRKSDELNHQSLDNATKKKKKGYKAGKSSIKTKKVSEKMIDQGNNVNIIEYNDSTGCKQVSKRIGNDSKDLPHNSHLSNRDKHLKYPTVPNCDEVSKVIKEPQFHVSDPYEESSCSSEYVASHSLSKNSKDTKSHLGDSDRCKKSSNSSNEIVPHSVSSDDLICSMLPNAKCPLEKKNKADKSDDVMQVAKTVLLNKSAHSNSDKRKFKTPFKPLQDPCNNCDYMNSAVMEKNGSIAGDRSSAKFSITNPVKDMSKLEIPPAHDELGISEMNQIHDKLNEKEESTSPCHTDVAIAGSSDSMNVGIDNRNINKCNINNKELFNLPNVEEVDSQNDLFDTSFQNIEEGNGRCVTTEASNNLFNIPNKVEGRLHEFQRGVEYNAIQHSKGDSIDIANASNKRTLERGMEDGETLNISKSRDSCDNVKPVIIRSTHKSENGGNKTLGSNISRLRDIPNDIEISSTGSFQKSDCYRSSPPRLKNTTDKRIDVITILKEIPSPNKDGLLFGNLSFSKVDLPHRREVKSCKLAKSLIYPKVDYIDCKNDLSGINVIKYEESKELSYQSSYEPKKSKDTGSIEERNKTEKSPQNTDSTQGSNLSLSGGKLNKRRKSYNRKNNFKKKKEKERKDESNAPDSYVENPSSQSEVNSPVSQVKINADQHNDTTLREGNKVNDNIGVNFYQNSSEKHSENAHNKSCGHSEELIPPTPPGPKTTKLNMTEKLSNTHCSKGSLRNNRDLSLVHRNGKNSGDASSGKIDIELSTRSEKVKNSSSFCTENIGVKEDMKNSNGNEAKDIADYCSMKNEKNHELKSDDLMNPPASIVRTSENNENTVSGAFLEDKLTFSDHVLCGDTEAVEAIDKKSSRKEYQPHNKETIIDNTLITSSDKLFCDEDFEAIEHGHGSKINSSTRDKSKTTKESAITSSIGDVLGELVDDNIEIYTNEKSKEKEISVKHQNKEVNYDSFFHDGELGVSILDSPLASSEHGKTPSVEEMLFVVGTECQSKVIHPEKDREELDNYLESGDESNYLDDNVGGDVDALLDNKGDEMLLKGEQVESNAINDNGKKSGSQTEDKKIEIIIENNVSSPPGKKFRKSLNAIITEESEGSRTAPSQNSVDFFISPIRNLAEESNEKDDGNDISADGLSNKIMAAKHEAETKNDSDTKSENELRSKHSASSKKKKCQPMVDHVIDVDANPIVTSRNENPSRNCQNINMESTSLAQPSRPIEEWNEDPLDEFFSLKPVLRKGDKCKKTDKSLNGSIDKAKNSKNKDNAGRTSFGVSKKDILTDADDVDELFSPLNTKELLPKRIDRYTEKTVSEKDKSKNISVTENNLKNSNIIDVDTIENVENTHLKNSSPFLDIGNSHTKISKSLTEKVVLNSNLRRLSNENAIRSLNKSDPVLHLKKPSLLKKGNELKRDGACTSDELSSNVLPKKHGQCATPLSRKSGNLEKGKYPLGECMFSPPDSKTIDRNAKKSDSSAISEPLIVEQETFFSPPNSKTLLNTSHQECAPKIKSNSLIYNKSDKKCVISSKKHTPTMQLKSVHETEISNNLSSTTPLKGEMIPLAQSTVNRVDDIKEGKRYKSISGNSTDAENLLNNSKDRNKDNVTEDSHAPNPQKLGNLCVKQRSSSPSETNKSDVIDLLSQKRAPVIMASRLNKKQMIYSSLVCQKLGGKIVQTFSEGVSHLIVATDENNTLSKMAYTYKYLMALVSGLWIVSIRWLLDSLHNENFLPEEKFEAKGDPAARHTNIPRLFRTASQTKRRCIFENYRIYIVGTFQETQISREQLINLLQKCGAELLYSPKEFVTNSSKHETVMLTDNLHQLSSDDIDLCGKYDVRPIHPDWVIESIINFRVEDTMLYLLQNISG